MSRRLEWTWENLSFGPCRWGCQIETASPDCILLNSNVMLCIGSSSMLSLLC